MDFLLDLLQGAGIAAAIGIRPFLPVLLVGALASADLGIDFDGGDLAFLESPGFLAGALAGVLVLDLVSRRGSAEAADRGPLLAAVAVVAVALGGLEGAGSMTDNSDDPIPGAIVGVAAAALGFAAARSLFGRVRRRLDADAQGMLPLYGEGAAVAAAGLSVAFPPLAVLVVGALGWLLLGGRRREGEKYAGLRILR